MDSNYIAIDAVSRQIVDCDHDEMGRARIIALTLMEFLDRLLKEGPDPYWLSQAFTPYGELRFEPGAEFYRYVDRGFWEGLGEEVGPDQCQSLGCDRRHLFLSVLCRRHHYENLKGRACPFDWD